MASGHAGLASAPHGGGGGAHDGARAIAPASRQPEPKVSAATFMFGKFLGEGAYSRVVLGQHKGNGGKFAVKIMDKEFIKREKKVKFVMQERDVLTRLRSSSVLRLFYTFQDKDYLFMVLELCAGGDLLGFIRHHARQQDASEDEEFAYRPPVCPLESVVYYAAAIVRALEYMHSQGIVHRDLKPENVLLDESGRIKVGDMGTCRDLRASDRGNHFVGTAEFVSPEVLNDQDAGPGVDLWALGCIVYQMLCGRTPFRGASEYLLFRVIAEHPGNGALSFPPGFPAQAQALVEALLQHNPAERLGMAGDGFATDYASLKAHPFFAGVDWDGFAAVAPPEQPPRPPLPPCTIDGADEDWMLKGAAHELDEAEVCHDHQV